MAVVECSGTGRSSCSCSCLSVCLHYTTVQLQLHYLKRHYTRLHYIIPHYSTQHYSILQYTKLITPHHNYNCNCNYTTLHHTTSSSWGWGDHCNHCNHSKKHNFNHLSVHQWIRSAIRDSQQLSYRFPIFETSATALCGTTGNNHNSNIM